MEDKRDVRKSNEESFYDGPNRDSNNENQFPEGIRMDHINNIPSSTNIHDSAYIMASSKDELVERRKDGNIISKRIVMFRNALSGFAIRSKNTLLLSVKVAIGAGLVAYLTSAAVYWHQQGRKPLRWCVGEGFLLILLALLMWSIIYYKIIIPLFHRSAKSGIKSEFTIKCLRFIKRLIISCLVVAFLVFIVLDTAGNRRRLVSLAGVFTFIMLGFIFSKHPNEIRWRTVFMGIFIQIAIGMLVIRWDVGRAIFLCIGNRSERFLEFGFSGAAFVYGDFIVNDLKVFAFQSLSVIYFLCMIVEMLFYLGWMQVICFKLGWLIQTILGTTIVESVNAVTTVFLGMTEAPLLYKPYIKDLTQSEMHAVMAGGFSTVAGAVFSAYSALGVNPAYIITASVMAAPTALCLAKLIYPETEVSKTSAKNFTFYKSEEYSIIDAAIKGAVSGTYLIAGIISTVIACVSMVSFINSALTWCGLLVGVEDFTFEYLVGKILTPLPYIMGVAPEQCQHVAKLIGIKLSLNEFLAYKELGVMKAKNLLTPRSEAIASFALCSFANPGSLGIFVAVLISLCPEQKKKISQVAIRSLISGSTTSLLTASIAGMLIPEEGFGGQGCSNCTMPLTL